MVKNFMPTASDQNPAAEFLTLDTNAMEWSNGGGEGFWKKLLHCDERTGQRTVLMKIDSGAYVASHFHDTREQIYVLEGDFYEQTRSYAAGDFIVREPRTSHIAGSISGGLVLLVFG